MRQEARAVSPDNDVVTVGVINRGVMSLSSSLDVPNTSTTALYIADLSVVADQMHASFTQRAARCRHHW